jgi:DNA repair photolyase
MIDADTVSVADDPTKAILSKSALNEKSLCDYVINVATGCRHGCRFCYVPGTPNIRTRGEMLSETVDVDDGQEEWGEYVLYRDDIPDRLPGILDRKRTWHETERGQGIVGISFHTDCFMDARAGDITTSVVEALSNHDRYARILTRNPMLASSYMEVFEDAGEYVTVGSSIPTLDEEEIAALEPNAPSIESRLRGLKRFADADVPVYVSMSPTYPTIDSPGKMRDLLERIAALDPEVVFHEPINPRGKNFEMTVAAAEEAGLFRLANSLVEIQGPDAWLRYACYHFRWVQEIARDLDLPVHLWPDKDLVNRARSDTQTWLSNWRQRQSPEAFAGRETPSNPPMNPPPLFKWETEEGSGF